MQLDHPKFPDPSAYVRKHAITHELKCWPEYFEETISGGKTFEIRYDDRDFMVGDTIRLREWEPSNEQYSGRECWRRVTYITTWQQHPFFVVMALIEDTDC